MTPKTLTYVDTFIKPTQYYFLFCLKKWLDIIIFVVTDVRKPLANMCKHDFINEYTWISYSDTLFPFQGLWGEGKEIMHYRRQGG